MFNDLVEAQVVGSQPPLTDSWVFVWLAREDAVDLGLGRFGPLGTDTFPRTIATLHQQHAMHMERYRRPSSLGFALIAVSAAS